MSLDSGLPSSLTCSVLDNTKAHQELETYIDAVLEYISNNAGFTVIGWYKRGEIVDVSKDSKDKSEKVGASELGYHVVSIRPTHSIVHGEILNEQKYRITNLPVIEDEE